jgi:hypothetical protein
MDARTSSQDGAPRYRFPMPDDLYQLRVSLIDIEPTIWQRLLVPKDITLPSLHSILQAVMGWTGSHLHQFKVGEVCFAEPNVDADPGPIDHARVTVSQLLPRSGTSCIYEYDFGDGWEHLIELEGEVPPATVTEPVPRCVAGARACPPEDCGGPPGYAQLLAALGDPDHEEHAQYAAWLSREFDPEAFGVELVNRRLAGLAGRRSTTRARRR